MSFIPDHWGPYVWACIHILSLGAPEEMNSRERGYFAAFFNNLPNILPCSLCANHLRENLIADPVENHLQGKQSLFEWTVKLHNTVNKQNNKPEMSVEDALKHWRRICLGNSKEFKNASGGHIQPKLLVATCILVLVGAIIFFFLLKNKK
jgi:hypothetical protein